MNTILKMDRVVLKKEFSEKMKTVGEVYEIANVSENGYFVLRDTTKARAAVGTITFEDFDEYFIKEESFKGWTEWTPFYGYDMQNDCMYRTNHKKVQVRFLKDKVRAEACCCKDDEFNLLFGLKVAYLRCCNKVMLKREKELEKELKSIYIEVTDNNEVIKRMIDSL